MKVIKSKVKFATDEERIEFASKFLRDRLNSLKKDCEHCLFGEHPTPFPALLYCFSTVDLLGALYHGDGLGQRSKKEIEYLSTRDKKHNAIGPTRMSKTFMKEIMNYDKETRDKLQGIFRHKLVHLAIPNPSGDIAWSESHHGEKHLLLEEIHKPEPGITWPGVEVTPKSVFHISIWDFVLDIEKGAEHYLEKLISESKLQKRFDNAINNIYFGKDLTI